MDTMCESYEVGRLTTPLTESHFKAETDPPPLCSTPLAVLFTETCRKQLEREAFVYRRPGVQRVSLTFGQLLETSGKIAAALLDAGVQVRETVALFAPNSAEYNLAEYGIILTGAAVVRLHSFLKSAEDLKHVVKKAGCKGLLFHPGFDKEYLDVIKGLTADPEVGLEFCYSLVECEGFIFLDAIVPDRPPSKVCLPRKIEQRLQEVRLEDPVSIYMTSGSTGFPKLVPMNSTNLVNKYPGKHARWGVRNDDIIINDRPCSHIGSLGTFTVRPGLTRVVLDPRTTSPGKDPAFFFQVVEEERPTLVAMYPYLFNCFLEVAKSRTYDYSSARVLMTGGQSVPKNVLKEVLEFRPVINVYGGTESSGTSILSTIPSDPLEDRINFTGYPMPYVELKIVTDSGETTPIGVAGELCIKSPLLFTGYIQDDVKTRSVMVDGWFKTDDMAVMDARGYCSILGRKTEVIIRASMNIYPSAVEQILLQHQKVDKAMVLGVPDKVLGEEVCACVVPKEGVSVTREEMVAYCQKHLSGEASADGRGMKPKYILVWECLPLNANQKLDRKRVSQMVMAQLGFTR